VPHALARLAAGFQNVDRVITEGDAFAEYDFRVPMLSLPRLLGTDVATIPGDTPYLRIDKGRSAAWRERLRRSEGINVGIAWAGNPNHTRDAYRSIELKALAPLGRVRGARFVSLQKGDSGIWGSVPPSGLDLADVKAELHDFEDTAALIDALDLVISVDTAVLHLAGALGKPTWALLTTPPDFRWMDIGDSTPWYPTMRLFRQRRREDWSEVIDRVSKALETACSSGRYQPEKTIEAPMGRSAAIASPARTIETATCGTAGLFVVGETRHGMMQYLPDDLPVGQCMDLYGEYLQPALALLERIVRPGMVVFEASPGIGAHSVPIARMVTASGHVILDEQDVLSRRVLQHNLRIAGAANVTVLPAAHASQAVDDLGLRRLDLFKANRVHDRGALQHVTRTLHTLRPAVFLESTDQSNFVDACSQLQSLDYDVRILTIPYFEASNFRRSRVDPFQDQGTFVIVAIPRERECG
jgi:hypothetical protein